MTSKKARPKNITEYIDAAPKQAQKKLREDKKWRTPLMDLDNQREGGVP